MKTRNLSAAFFSLFAVGASVACSVQFDGFVYDDEAFEKEQGGQGGSSGDGDSDGDGDEPSEFCVTFCDDSSEFCEFDTALGYKDEEDCLDACATFDTTSLECRLVELGKAEDEPDEHCPATLLDGGDVCPDATPDPCETFCEDSNETCAFGTELGYENKDECLSVCERLSEEDFDCRVIHLGFAGNGEEGSAETHCPHQLEDGGGVCEDATASPCEVYCADSDETCPFGSELGYADEDECITFCEGLAEEDFECREIHLGFAADGDEDNAAETHCPHTLQDGGGVCSDET